jgi:ComF family protein
VLLEEERSVIVPGCDVVIASVPYEPPVRDLLVRAKYAGDPHPLTALAALFGELLAVEKFVADVVVPVPLSRSRLRRRGYDQVVPLARAAATRMACPLDEEALRRCRGGDAQVGLTRVARRRNLVGRFKCTRELRDRRVLLVDDVVTTGATLEAAAKALRGAGAASVAGACLFRTRAVRAQK